MNAQQCSLMRVIVDGKDVFVPYEEIPQDGYVAKIPIIDDSNLIEVTTLGSEAPEYISNK